MNKENIGVNDEKLSVKKHDISHVELHTSGGSLWTDIRSIYKFKNVVGGGHFGTVRNGYKKGKEPKKFYAIKSIIKKNVVDKEFDAMIKEVEILSTLDHPNIIKFYETYNDDYYFHIVMELANGKDVLDKIIEEGSLSEKKVARITYQVLSALVYCHSKGICHRDIKPENILFANDSNEGEIKLIDFGLSRKYNEREKMQTILGTSYYVAPEVLMGCYDKKCDIWSVGAFVYIMLTGTTPFSGKSNNTVFKKILEEEVQYPREKFKNISNECQDFLKMCLIKKPELRVTGEQALMHKWFSSVFSEVHHKCRIDPQLLVNLKCFNYTEKFQKIMLKFLVNELDKKELDHLRDVFQAMDIDHTGALNKEELLEGFKNAGINITKDEVADIINKINDCEQGKINYSEFCIAAINFKANIDKEKLIAAFFYFDTNKTGHISISNIEDAFLRSGKRVLDSSELNQIIIEATKGKESTKITLDEFLEMFGCNS